MCHKKYICRGVGIPTFVVHHSWIAVVLSIPQPAAQRRHSIFSRGNFRGIFYVMVWCMACDRRWREWWQQRKCCLNAALQKKRLDVDMMMCIMRPAKGVLGVEKRPIADVAADDDVGIQESVRRKRGVSWTEIADRPPKTSLSTDERVAFLRLVKSIRANTIGMQVRDASGRWAPPSCCVSLAAQLLQIAPRTGERIHSEFQQQKAVPDVKGPLQRERPWLIEAVFGKATIKQWVTEHLLACVAKKQRATYQTIRDYLRHVAPIHIQDTSSLLLMEEDLAETIEAACKVLHYQNVRRWCSKEGIKVTKLACLDLGTWTWVWNRNWVGVS